MAVASASAGGANAWRDVGRAMVAVEGEGEGQRCGWRCRWGRTSEELSLQAHLIERVDGLVIVGLDLGLLDVLEPLVSHDC